MVQAALDAMDGDLQRCVALFRENGAIVEPVAEQQELAYEVEPQTQQEPITEKQQLMGMGFSEADTDAALAQAGAGNLQRALSIALDPAGHMPPEEVAQLAAKYLQHGRPATS